jgi:hypothetical protein
MLFCHNRQGKSLLFSQHAELVADAENRIGQKRAAPKNHARCIDTARVLGHNTNLKF